MGAGLSLQTRRAMLEHMASAYREAPRAKKRVLLAEFTQTTGYHRTYARWLLNHREDVLQTVARHPRQPRSYNKREFQSGSEIETTLAALTAFLRVIPAILGTAEA